MGRADDKLHTIINQCPKLHGKAVLAVPCHCASPDLHYEGSVRLQAFQAHRVLLASDGVGNAISLPLLWERGKM